MSPVSSVKPSSTSAKPTSSSKKAETSDEKKAEKKSPEEVLEELKKNSPTFQFLESFKARIAKMKSEPPAFSSGSGVPGGFSTN